MKQILLYIAALLVVVPASAQRNSYKGQLYADTQELVQEGDMLHVSVVFDIEDIKLSSRQTLTLVPQVISGSVYKDLPRIEILGRNRYMVYKRREVMMTKRESQAYMRSHDMPIATAKGYGRKGDKLIEYRLTVPFEPWMKEARLDLNQFVSLCGKNPSRRSTSELFASIDLEEPIVIPVYEIHPELAYIQPKAEAIKRREVISQAFLDFAVGKTAISPDYMNNPHELKKITDMMMEARLDTTIKVNMIHVIGYASPEGTLKFNQHLSEARANALVNYLIPLFDYPRSMYHETFGGENWEGLREKVEESGMMYRDEVLKLLSGVTNNIAPAADAKLKSSIKTLRKGVPYKYMLKEFYPSLRKAICKLDYEVRKFSVEEAKVLMQTRPQNLSLNEMYHVANLYEPGTQQFSDVFETAVRMYPEDQAANLNAATAALARGDVASAETYLGRISDHTPQYYNTLGVSMMLKGQYTEAEQPLNKAAESGLLEAKANLEQIKLKLENIQQIKELEESEKNKAAGR